MNDPQKEQQQLWQLKEFNFSENDIARIIKHKGWSPGKILSAVNRLLDAGATNKKYAAETFRDTYPELFDDAEDQFAEPDLSDTPQPRHARKASEFGESKKHFLWYPYLPSGEFTVLMADGGTGKGILTCGIAAAITRGKKLPGEDSPRRPGTVLFISAEDDGEDFRDRLQKSGADLDRCMILDRSDSVGMSIAEDYEEFALTVKQYKPDLVVLDPWHGFLGADVDISRVNAIRPVLQKLSLLAKEQNTAIIAVSHVNKRAQGENANNAATGSTDFINASRSALRLIFDEEDPDLLRRILVHTKSNFAMHGKSVCFRIDDGGLVWDGYSEITKLTLEQAARNRKSVGEQIAQAHAKDESQQKLISALMDAAKGTEKCGRRFSYAEFKAIYGEEIFGEGQPKRALDALVPTLKNRGVELKTGLHSSRAGNHVHCFFIQKESEEDEEESTGSYQKEMEDYQF